MNLLKTEFATISTKYFKMGEIADDMINGTSCSLCGQYFQNPKKHDEPYTHGYPVVCEECWQDLTKNEKKSYQKAEVHTF